MTIVYMGVIVDFSVLIKLLNQKLIKMKVKNLIAPLLGLIVGLLIGYFLLQKKENSKISFSVSSMKAGVLWGPIPDRVTAEQWVNNYRKEADRLWFPLRTQDDNILKGFWVDKKMIDTVFAQDSSANGLRIYFAQKNSNETRKYNLVFVGTKPDTGSTTKKDPNGNDDFGTYYDYVDPCPKNCGTTGN